jgi:hypothetical protein
LRLRRAADARAISGGPQDAVTPTGGIATFWPEDAHMSTLAVWNGGLERKTVIKVSVPV